MDFFINYYVTFLLDKHISLVCGFFIWHIIVFLSVLITAVICVFLLIRLKNSALKLLEFETNNKHNSFLIINEENGDKVSLFFSFVIFCASILFIWFILPFSTSFFPVKTDVGAALFLSLLLLPLTGILLGISLCKKQETVKKLISKIFHCLSAFIPVSISCLSVFMLAGTFSFRDIVSIQNSMGILTWFCFPAIIGVFVIIYSLAELYHPEMDTENDYGKSYNLYIFTKYLYLFAVGMFVVTLFFGGYMPPVSLFFANFFDHSPFWYGFVLSLEQTLWLILKTFILLFVVMGLKVFGVMGLKKHNSDEIFWKYLTPLSVINLLSVSMIAVNFGGFYVL